MLLAVLLAGCSQPTEPIASRVVPSMEITCETDGHAFLARYHLPAGDTTIAYTDVPNAYPDEEAVDNRWMFTGQSPATYFDIYANGDGAAHAYNNGGIIRDGAGNVLLTTSILCSGITYRTLVGGTPRYQYTIDHISNKLTGTRLLPNSGAFNDTIGVYGDTIIVVNRLTENGRRLTGMRIEIAGTWWVELSESRYCRECTNDDPPMEDP